MLDPLRSLAELVRTLTKSRANSRGNTSETQRQRVTADPTRSEPGSPGITSAEPLRERLRQRLRAIGNTDRRRAREAFVETVLAAELGDAVTLDPAMAEVVNKIAAQLGSDAATDRDLGLLFDELSREKT
jgi:phage-related baseplate assembly protein